jgi:reverse gyrase
MGAGNVEAFVDSFQVANQINQVYEVKDESIRKYYDKALMVKSTFNAWIVHHVPRSNNKKADVLSKLAAIVLRNASHEIHIEVLRQPSVDNVEVNVITTQNTWMTPIINYLQNDQLLEDLEKARKIWIKSLQYVMERGRLYRRSYLGPLMKCVNEVEANYVIREIHEGICGMYARPKSIVAKAMKAGFFWQGMYQTALEVV